MGAKIVSDELRLPDELAAIEARLAALPLAGSGVDRDRLLYDAGWAAGAAGAETARLAFLPRTAALCSAASAAIAASLAVAVTLALQPTPLLAESKGGRTPREALAAGDPAERQSATGSAGVDPARLPRADGPEGSSLRFASLRVFPNNSPLSAFRRGSSLTDLADFDVSTASINGTAAPPRTARELLEEFMPRSSEPAFPFMQLWPWQRSADSGDTI